MKNYRVYVEEYTGYASQYKKYVHSEYNTYEEANYKAHELMKNDEYISAYVQQKTEKIIPEHKKTVWKKIDLTPVNIPDTPVNIPDEPLVIPPISRNFKITWYEGYFYGPTDTVLSETVISETDIREAANNAVKTLPESEQKRYEANIKYCVRIAWDSTDLISSKFCYVDYGSYSRFIKVEAE